MTLGEWLSRPWPRISAAQAVATWSALGLLTLLVVTDDDGWIPILTGADLIFHEAGHVIYGIFGRRLMLYGGTLGQFTFPFICMAYFWSRRQPSSAAICGGWLFENFFYTAQYMGDARARVLPLVGCSGEHCHDWRNIFIRWHALEYDTAVAAITRILGGIGLLVIVVWFTWVWWKCRDGYSEEDRRFQEFPGSD